MKKLLVIISVFICSLFIFAGCGIQGGANATGVEFVRDVFYVDYSVSTFLDYKVYPSTAENVYATYFIEDDIDINSFFNLRNGAVIVTDKRFTSIVVRIRVNDFEDTCEVRLREYPTSVYFSAEQDMVDGGLVYSLDLYGMFSSGERHLENDEYNYVVTSSNPSVIEVVSQERLLVKSTGRRGSSRITVQVCNSAGQEMQGLSASITLNVNQAIEESYATFGDKFVMVDGGERSLSLSVGDENKIDALFFDKQGFLLEQVGFNCYLSNDEVFELVYQNDEYILRVIGEGEVTLTIQSKGSNGAGEPVRIQYKFQVQFL